VGGMCPVPNALLGWPRASFYTLQESTTRREALRRNLGLAWARKLAGCRE
jgi:hypothetical protein